MKLPCAHATCEVLIGGERFLLRPIFVCFLYSCFRWYLRVFKKAPEARRLLILYLFA